MPHRAWAKIHAAAWSSGARPRDSFAAADASADGGTADGGGAADADDAVEGVSAAQTGGGLEGGEMRMEGVGERWRKGRGSGEKEEARVT